jgi:hypothetical protein
MATVKFINITIKNEVENIYHFIFNFGSWSKYVFKKHPALKKALDFHAKKDRVNYIKKYASGYWLKNQKIIEKSRRKYEKDWRKVERKFFNELESIIGTKFPKNKKISAYISINPICPRFLNKWSFNIFNKFDTRRSREIIMHECCHFLYFKKWKEMFPKAKEKNFDAPHLIWHLSELASPIILNDPKIKKYLNIKAGFYEEHEAVRIGQKTAPQYFAEIYKKSHNLENFIKIAFKIINKHRNLFFLN